jgi:alpha-tubulin suppressor-like RCC1 family protein
MKQNSIDAMKVCLDESIYISKISAGVAHSSAITVFGQLLVWGSNNGCQLGYAKEMKEALVPVLFGGKIQIEKKVEEEEVKEEEKKIEHVNETVHAEKEFKHDNGFKYIDVVCGSTQTLAIIN